MDEEDVHEVTWLVAAREGEDLVDRDVDRVQEPTTELVADEGHEPPRRVPSPIDPGALASSLHDGSHEAGKREVHLHLVSRSLQKRPVGGKSGRHPGLGVVEETEVPTIARRLRAKVGRCVPGEVPLVVLLGCQRREHLPLKEGRRQSRAPVSHASRLWPRHWASRSLDASDGRA